MPKPLIASGLQLGGQLINRALGRKDRIREKKYALELDKYTRSKDLEQWNRQNEYNRAMWDLQNQYNTPKAQMKRFKEAGLNPNLIYSRGDSGSAQGVQTAELAKYGAPSSRYQPQPLNLGATIDQYQNLRLKGAQVDNVKANTNKTNAETGLKIGQKMLLEITGRQKETDIKHTKQKIKNLAESLKGLEYDNQYKKFRAELANEGFTVSDPKILRVVFKALKNQGIDPGDMGAEIIKGIYDSFKEAPSWFEKLNQQWKMPMRWW